MKKLKSLAEVLVGRIIIALAWFYAWWVFRVINHIEIIGKNNISHQSNVLYVVNHQTLIDSFLVGLGVFSFWDIFFHPSRIPWNAPDGDNFFKKKMFRFVFKFLNNIPITRDSNDGKALLKQQEILKNKLKQAELVLFFEGTRTRTGVIGDCQCGVADLIYENHPLVIPILLENVQPIMPIELGFRFFKVCSGFAGSMIIGKPISNFKGALDKPKNSKTKRDIGEIVRQAVVELQH